MINSYIKKNPNFIWRFSRLRGLARLIVHIIRNGKFRHSGYDPSAERRQIALALKDYAPPTRSQQSLKEWLMKNAFLRALISEAAYLKNSFKTQGGHLSLPDAYICYVRMPKAASTALCKTLLETRFPGLKQRTLTPEQINFLSDVHLEKSLTRQENHADFFTVVRNPFARIVSVYHEFFESGKTPFLYADYLFGILHQTLTFRQFISAIQQIPDELKDQHLKPQHLFLRYYEKMNVRVKVMKLETPETIQTFLRIHGLQFDVFNQTQTPYDYRNYYDATTLQAVSALYREDILRFGYEKTVEDIQFTIEHRPVQM